jgi:hypothetical protein
MLLKSTEEHRGGARDLSAGFGQPLAMQSPLLSVQSFNMASLKAPSQRATVSASRCALFLVSFSPPSVMVGPS